MPKKVYFYYGPMNSSKTAHLVMSTCNYRERNKNPLVLKPTLDVRDGVDPLIVSRPGMSTACTLFERRDDLFDLVAHLAGATERDSLTKIRNHMKNTLESEPKGEHDLLVEFGNSFEKRVDCVMVDEGQFLTVQQAKQLTDVADYLDIPVMIFGLRNDFQANPFPASAYLMANAEAPREIKGICFCGSKATHVLRTDEDGKVVKEGEQISVGGNDKYHSVCRFHWKAAIYQ